MPSPHDRSNRAAAITVIGSITRDSDTADPATRHWGGVPVYAGITLARRGLHVTAVANLARADQPRARRLLDAEGVQCRLGPSEFTTTFAFERVETGDAIAHDAPITSSPRGTPTSPANLAASDAPSTDTSRTRRSPGPPPLAPTSTPSADDRRQTLVSAAAPILASALDDTALLEGLVYLGPVHERDIDPALYERTFRSAAVVALDLQGLLRPTAIGPVVERVTDTLDTLDIRARFLKVSEHELAIVAASLSLGPTAGPRELLRRWRVEELLVTMGARGGEIHTADRRSTYAAAAVPGPTRSIGAGDVMFAAYIAARLFDGHSIDRAARRAAEFAGRQVAGRHIRPSTLAASHDDVDP